LRSKNKRQIYFLLGRKWFFGFCYDQRSIFNLLMALMEYYKMNKHSLLGMISACTVALILSNSAQAAPFIIDDFDVNTASSVADATIGGPVSGPSVIDGTNTVMNVTGGGGWTRTLIADLSAGDSMATSVCIFSFCGAGHVSMAGGSASGTGTFEYNGSAIDLSSYTLLGFDWGADIAGASVDIIFSDSSNITSTVASWSPLADTKSALVPQTRMGITWGGLESSEITKIQFVVTGVGNLDSSIDNFTAVVPVPAAAWLFGSALLGLAGVKRRKAQASR
jgi:hypothetical protein